MSADEKGSTYLWAGLTCPECNTVGSYQLEHTTPCIGCCGMEVQPYGTGEDEAEWGEIQPEVEPGPEPGPTPDDTAAPYGPYTYGKRRRNPYYLAGRDIWQMKDGEEGALMINKNADVTDVIHAFGLGYDLGEVVAKICRLYRKEGTNIRQEFIKMHEHIQAAEDAWAAEEGEK